MAQATLSGRKTQTRRIVKPRNGESLFVGWDDEFVLNNENKDWVLAECPYGTPGDQLYVRETWLPAAWNAQTRQIKAMYRDHTKSPWFTPYPDDYTGEKFNNLWLSICAELDKKQIHPNDEGIYDFRGMRQMPLRWRPSIHMPRAACRLRLQITDVRVERLQDISEEDAIAEGVLIAGKNLYNGSIYKDYTGESLHEFGWSSACRSFQSLWQSINSPESWDENPWVWVIEFEKINEA